MCKELCLLVTVKLRRINSTEEFKKVVRAIGETELGNVEHSKAISLKIRAAG